MRPVLAVVVIVAVVTGFVLRAKAEDAASVLVLDVYSVKVPSDVVQEKGFWLWTKSLKAGVASSREHDPVIHAVYRLGGVVSMKIAIILAGPRQSGFLTIIDKPQPDRACRVVGYGQARNPKIDVYPDGSPRTPTDPAIHAGSEENRFDRCHRGAKQRRLHSDGKSCLIRSDRLPD
jgi:hypothetical protein